MNIYLFIGIYHILIYYFIVIYDVMNILCCSTNRNENEKNLRDFDSGCVFVFIFGFIATVIWISYFASKQIVSPC